ncbi:MAG TPA: Ada metal-binding domain-containing protein [Sedimentisphaerales bacterium]|nr:Ada metal-binding domain-containing protein [Sedimentisphaerales bacterium]
MKKRISLAIVATIVIFVLNIGSVLAKTITLIPVETIQLQVIHPENITDINETVWLDITRKIEDKITTASIKLAPKSEIESESAIYEKLEIYVDILKIEDQQKMVFSSSVFLSKTLSSQQTNQQVILWKNQTPLKLTEVNTIHIEIEKTILSQVDIFLKACIVTPALKATQGKPDTVTDTKFVSSKTSKIFHKIDCTSAKRIKSENKIFYNGRTQALEDGKRPCKNCEP